MACLLHLSLLTLHFIVLPASAAILSAETKHMVGGFFYKCGSCHCDKTHYDIGGGVTARCIGMDITSVPRDLPANLSIL